MAAAGNTGDLKVTVVPAEFSEQSPEHNSACLVAGGIMRCSEKWGGGVLTSSGAHDGHGVGGWPGGDQKPWRSYLDTVLSCFSRV